jgi:hypothetical protein
LARLLAIASTPAVAFEKSTATTIVFITPDIAPVSRRLQPINAASTGKWNKPRPRSEYFQPQKGAKTRKNESGFFRVLCFFAAKKIHSTTF